MTECPYHRGGSPVARLVDGCPIRVWGMTPDERLRRMLEHIGVAEVAPWDGVPVPGRSHVLVRGDHVFASALLSELVARPGTVLTCSGRPVAAHVSDDRAADAVSDLEHGRLTIADIDIVEANETTAAYDRALRKRDKAYVMRLTPETVQEVERRTFADSYKGVTDIITRHVWPMPARVVTRWCAEAGITPNVVTAVSLLLVLLAMWLFWNGDFLTGLLAAWAMTFLDTVDGKLARVTLTSSKFGNVFDHGIDLIHPPFWYWAWAIGVWHHGNAPPGLDLALAITLIGYVVQRLQEGLFIAFFKMEMHVWRRFDSLFRLVVARRNPNLVLLTIFALAGRPGEGLIAVAAWTAVSLVVHTLQIVQAARQPRPLRSWLAQ